MDDVHSELDQSVSGRKLTLCLFVVVPLLALHPSTMAPTEVAVAKRPNTRVNRASSSMLCDRGARPVTDA